jgi:hypothetical protein
MMAKPCPGWWTTGSYGRLCRGSGTDETLTSLAYAIRTEWKP